MKTILPLFIWSAFMQPLLAEQESSETVDTIYQSFVDEFRQAEGQENRLRLIRDASKELNDHLQEKLLTPKMAKLLPTLVSVRLLDIDDSFLTVIDEHPDEKIRALALYSFAKHCGNNGRDETCKTTLAYLRLRHGDLPYKDGMTFGKAAEEAFYFLTNLSVGKQAPAIVGKDADGTLFRIADYRGKVVMLRFWGDWCPACRAMFDYERDLVQEYKNRPFVLVGVNSDPLEELKAAQQRANLTWRTIWDGGDTRGPIATMLRVKQWPTIVVIDGNGVIRFRSEGLSKPQLESVLSRYVDEAAKTSLGELTHN